MEDKFVYIDNDLPTNSFNTFDEMRAEGFLCDVNFKIGNRKVSAHRSLLAASSPYLRSLFLSMKSEFIEEMSIPEVEPDALEALINFSYRSHLEISADRVQHLLTASSFLQMDHVFDACCDFLSRTMHPNNVLDIRRFAATRGFSKLELIANEYIQKYFVQVSHSEGFLDLPFSDLQEIICKDELQVASEELVFQAAMAWVKKSVASRECKLPELLTSIRMSLLSSDYLSHVASEDLIKNSVLCQNLLDEAMSSKSTVGCSSFVTRPRRFTTPEAELGIAASLPDGDNIESIFGVCAVSETGPLTVKYFVPTLGRWMATVDDDTVYAADATVVAMGKKLYVLGGCDSMGDVLDIVQVFDTETGTWDTIPSMNEKRYNAAAAVFSNKIYVFGGVTGFVEDFITCSVECFCPETNRWTYLPKMSDPRLGACAVTFGEHIYVLGGCGCDSDLSVPRDLKSVERYHPETNEWTSISEMTSDLCLRGAVALNKMIYVHGEKYVEAYDLLTEKWRRISFVRHHKSGFSLLAVGGKLYAVGGKLHDDDDTPFAVDVYDPKTDEWSEGVPFPECYYFIGAVTVPTSC